MINYKIYELMSECLTSTFEVYAKTLDVADFVPQKHIDKMHNWILKEMKKKKREAKREDKKIQKTLRNLIESGKVVDTTCEEYILAHIDFDLLTPSAFKVTTEKPVEQVVDGSVEPTTSESTELVVSSKLNNVGGESDVEE